jgi:hypothetical protein
MRREEPGARVACSGATRCADRGADVIVTEKTLARLFFKLLP